MHLLFPADPLNTANADETYLAEFESARAIGFSCSLFSFEDFEMGKFQAKPTLENQTVLYRGWMLTPEHYARLHTAIGKKGGTLTTNPEQYRRCHHLPEWYPFCQDLTPETVFTSRDADFNEVLAGKDWPAYFVKDYVKSLTTQRGSIAKTPAEVAEIVTLIEQYRGAVEGGVCIREFEPLIPESEERYFVLNGKAHARHGIAPAIAYEIAQRIESPFFSVDVVQSENGSLRLIELGDGQVSDRKKWPADQFMAMLNTDL
jgi:ATP-grasp domain, R2K clade family 3